MRAFFGVFCSKWAVYTIAALASGGDGGEFEPMRRKALTHALPDISDKMLTDTLRHLEAAGLVRREPFATVPAKVEYSLTSSGRDFIAPLESLKEWCEAHSATLAKAKSQLDTGKK